MLHVPGESCDVIAFYLPQFHPVPENDQWWGKGFTEWTNVAKARPRFRGHYQPHLPGELGFYDLRLPEVREQQATLARDHGITAFCYYHYWFNGRRLLERPFDEVLASGRPDFPFLLCWANENWTRAWDGGPHEILLSQEYSVEDDIAHIRSLLPAFRDPRYYRIGGKPVFIVYRASMLPDPRRTLDTWRSEAARAGVGALHLVRVDGHGIDTVDDPIAQGFDAAVGWIPNYAQQGRPLRWGRRWGISRRLGLTERSFGVNRVVPYERVMKNSLSEAEPAYLRYPCVTPSWDNSARRRQMAFITAGATPDLYQSWLEQALRRVLDRPVEQRLLFINAWNEWAEGNHLEPDQRWGRAYLDATRSALERIGCLGTDNPA